jgi:hypothetical protein
METVNCTFTDVTGSSTHGQAQLAVLSGGERFIRAAKRGGLFAGIALLFLPIPGLHLICIPLMLVAIFMFVKTIRESQLIRHAEAECPACKQKVSFEGPINAVESKEICPNCRTLLKLQPVPLRVV